MVAMGQVLNNFVALWNFNTGVHGKIHKMCSILTTGDHRAKRMKIWDSIAVLGTTHLGLFSCFILWLVWGHSVHFKISDVMISETYCSYTFIHFQSNFMDSVLIRGEIQAVTSFADLPNFKNFMALWYFNHANFMEAIVIVWGWVQAINFSTGPWNFKVYDSLIFYHVYHTWYVASATLPLAKNPILVSSGKVKQFFKAPGPLFFTRPWRRKVFKIVLQITHKKFSILCLNFLLTHHHKSIAWDFWNFVNFNFDDLFTVLDFRKLKNLVLWETSHCT